MSGSVRRSVLGCCARILRPTAPHQVDNGDDVFGGDNGDDRGDHHGDPHGVPHSDLRGGDNGDHSDPYGFPHSDPRGGDNGDGDDHGSSDGQTSS